MLSGTVPATQNGSSFWMPLQLLLIKWVKNIFCSNKIPKSSADIVPASTVTASTSYDRPLQIDLCENAHLSRQKTVFAIKRAFFVKKVLCDIKYSRRDIFQDSVLNDKYFMSMVTKLSFEIGRFSAAFFESLILKTFFSENQRSMKNLT